MPGDDLITTNLTVLGAATYSTGITVSTGGVSVTGASTFNSPVTLATALTVSAGGIRVTGASTFSSPVTMSTGLTISTGGVSVTGASTFNSAVSIATGGLTLGTGGQNITNILAVTLSTYVPTAVTASSGRIDLVPTTSLTFTTNDRIILNLPSSWSPAGGVGVAGVFPTSSGGVGFNWTNAGLVNLTPSTGAYFLVVLRTT